VKRSRAAMSGARGRVRLLMAGVASATLVLTAAPAALAFAATGSPNPTSWRWDEVTGRLTACASRGGLGSLVNCRPAEAVDLPAFAPEEHRKGRRVIVFVPVPTEVAQPTPGTSTPRSSTRTGHVVSGPSARPVRPVRAVPAASPSFSPSPPPRSDDEDGGHD
jgi:hypothetical protein